jgi:hypothetical protein
MPRALKVFRTPVGFYDAIVAAPSQKAALAAWGTTTNLFASGDACVVEDPALQAEALAHPGEVIKKSRGDVAAMLGPEPLKRPARQQTLRAAEQPKARPTPDRSRLDAAERALADAENALEVELSQLARTRADIERQEHDARRRGEQQLLELRRARDEAAQSYANAGGVLEAEPARRSAPAYSVGSTRRRRAR